jgi:hypothetical protein
MGMLSLAIWTPIFFGVVLLALGVMTKPKLCGGSP